MLSSAPAHDYNYPYLSVSITFNNAWFQIPTEAAAGVWSWVWSCTVAYLFIMSSKADPSTSSLVPTVPVQAPPHPAPTCSLLPLSLPRPEQYPTPGKPSRRRGCSPTNHILHLTSRELPQLIRRQRDLPRDLNRPIIAQRPLSRDGNQLVHLDRGEAR